MTKSITELEARRRVLQDELDGQLDNSARNRMGQFATPTDLAVDILRYAMMHFVNGQRVRFIDPAIGTGSFYSALLSVCPRDRIESAVGYEIDPHYGKPARDLWGKIGLDARLEDFTSAEPPVPARKFNLLICNPPYVRHHHIVDGNKRRLRNGTRHAFGADISGLAGLYCYFLGLSHAWMSDDGLAGWLIPSEFMDVNYGAAVKRYLLDKVTLLRVHRFDPNDVQFADALVSSAIVWFRNTPPRPSGTVSFTFGGTLEKPKLERAIPIESLRREPKWTRYPKKEAPQGTRGPVLGEFFKIQRGLVTGNNNYFILSEREIKCRGLPMDAFRPILPSPRYVPNDEVMSDSEGHPVLERRLFLLDPPWTERQIREQHPTLWAYLEEGRAAGVADRYLCRHRTTWYMQEDRPPAPFVCTYLGRSDGKNGRPFRFILNNSKATAANVYLMMYPRAPLERVLLDRPSLNREVWGYLNTICPQAMLGEGRVYGGGLHKLEPKELGRVPAEGLVDLFSTLAEGHPVRQRNLFEL